MLKDCHSWQAWGPMCEPWLATVKAKDPNLLCSHSSLLEQHYFIPWCTSFSKSLLSLVIEKIVTFAGQCIACSLLRTLFPLLQSNTWVHFCLMGKFRFAWGCPSIIYETNFPIVSQLWWLWVSFCSIGLSYFMLYQCFNDSSLIVGNMRVPSFVCFWPQGSLCLSVERSLEF